MFVNRTPFKAGLDDDQIRYDRGNMATAYSYSLYKVTFPEEYILHAGAIYALSH
jgi:hypothetical protein